MTHRPFLLLTGLLIVFASACFGGDDEADGALTPDAAAQDLVEALAANDRAAQQRVIEPDLRKSNLDASAFGLPARDGKSIFTPVQVSRSTNYEDDKAYAAVLLTGSIKLADREQALRLEVLTREIDGRWYVTTRDNAYWKDAAKQKREREAAAADTATEAYRAQVDDDPSLPGAFVKPHPGIDGVLCGDRSCGATADDRRHTPAFGGVLPICTQQQLDRGQISDPYCYNSNPPTSGMHGQIAAPNGVHRQPMPKEALVHSMEHGSVVVWYNTTNQSVVSQLEAIVNAELLRQRPVVMSLYTEMETDTIAVTAWSRLDKFAAKDFTPERVQRFIVRHAKRFNPEGF